MILISLELDYYMVVTKPGTIYIDSDATNTYVAKEYYNLAS